MALIIIGRCYIRKLPSLPDSSGFRKIWHGIDWRLKKLLAADIFVRLAEGIPDIFIVLYVVNILKISISGFAWLISIQTFSTALVYIPISKLSDRMDRKPFVLLTFFIFALFPLILAFSTNIFWLTLAFIAAGLREIGEPARKALIVDLAKESIRARIVGVYYLIRGLVVFPASLIGGWLWTHNPHLPFYIAFITGMIGVVIFAKVGLGKFPKVAIFTR